MSVAADCLILANNRNYIRLGAQKKHLFECVGEKIAIMFEYRLAFSKIRRYVRYKASHPVLSAPGRVPSTGCENLSGIEKENEMSAVPFGAAPFSAAPYQPAPFRTVAGDLTGARSHLRMTRRGRTVLLTVFAAPLVIAALVVGIGAGSATATSSSSPLATITVVGGETLWGVARQIAPNADPRDVVADIISVNRLNSADIYPGEQLSIPAQYHR
jgi:hypothetical protein